MTPEAILATPPARLSQEQRQRYFEDGCLAVPAATPEHWLERIRQVSAEYLEKSRAVSQSDDIFDLGPEHTPEKPHVRRLRRAVDVDPFFWDVATAPFMLDIAADLVGPDVKFHSAKLNYKWPGAGEIVKWHQDCTSWPHTNYALVTLGIYLDDVTGPEGPLACINGSHKGPLYSHYGKDGAWKGALSDEDAAKAGAGDAVDLTGPAGSVVALDCRVVHGSAPNLTDRVRPLLLFVYTAADAFAWHPAPTPTSHTGELIRGKPAQFPHLDPRPCEVPPYWPTVGYGSIFSEQGKAKAS